MIIAIKPFDTLFFRDGKPFTMGDENSASGIFPPSPSTYYGAIRGAYFSNKIEGIDGAGDSNFDLTKDLCIKNIGYTTPLKDRMFQAPKDLILLDKKNYPMRLLKMIKAQNIVSNAKTPFLLGYGIDQKSEIKAKSLDEGALIKLYDLNDYLSGKDMEYTSYNMSTYICSEIKIGIGRESFTHTCDEGKLYRAEMKRITEHDEIYEKLEFVIEYDGLHGLPETGMMKLGGEAKAAYYRHIKHEVDSNYNFNIPMPDKFEIKDNTIQFKLYLSTPAVFNNGWLPSFINPETLCGIYNSSAGEVNIKLLTAAVGKPMFAGGYDIRKNLPKPMYKLVPAGSVYYFEMQSADGRLSEEKAVKALSDFHARSVSDSYEFKKQGFGIAFVGKIQKNECDK